MKTLVTTLLLSTTMYAHAGTIAETLLPVANELAHNGECQAYKYNVRTFNYEATMKKYAQGAYTRFGRDANISFKWEHVLSDIRYAVAVSNDYEDDFKAALDKLGRSKKFKAMFSATPGESCGEPEYCSITDFELYFVDGSILSCNFDYTT